MNGEKEQGVAVANLLWQYYELIIQNAKQGIKKLNPITTKEKKREFVQGFVEKYDEFIEKYMVKRSKGLDAHKVAALAIVQLLAMDLLEKPVKDGYYTAQEIAIDVGLTFMQGQLDDTLKKKGIVPPITQYVMPVPFSCDTPYAGVLARELEVAKDCPPLQRAFSLANELFLLEYITLLSNHIDPQLLKH
ncbi:MAG: hypothetical protein LBS96_01740 [Oscillospiraceae bacterium]|jgi:hypothetical protein|nr:hypothetical protein [Oscillospiraceae bacterium]